MATLATPVLRWADACATNIIHNNVTVGLVDQFGQPMSAFTNYTWGVDHPTCYEYCGRDKIYQVNVLSLLSVGFTRSIRIGSCRRYHVLLLGSGP
jgi:hypothetical protein